MCGGRRLGKNKAWGIRLSEESNYLEVGRIE